MKNKELASILIIILGLLVIGGGAYLYTKYSRPFNELTEGDATQIIEDVTDDSNDTEEKGNFYIKVLRPNGGENIPYGSIVMAGDLMIEWSSNYDNYSPTERAEVSLVNDSGSVVRKEKLNYFIEGNDTSSFVSSLVGDEGIELDTKYKIILCDEIDGTINCDTSDGFFYIGKIDDSVEYPEGKPIIKDITPSSGSMGTEVTIFGEELAGFEGDLIATFEREDGEKIMLWDEGGNNLEFREDIIEVTINEPCEEGETVYGPYSGLPEECNYIEFTPGNYKVYTEPWGKKSNIVEFILTE